MDNPYARKWMRTDQFVDDLEQALLSAAVACIETLSRDAAGEQVYAFCLYSTSGCTGVGFAAQTSEALDRANNARERDQRAGFANLVCADEWSFIYMDAESLVPADQLIDEFYDVLYHGDFEDVVLADDAPPAELQTFVDDLFCRVFVRVFLALKAAGAFDAAIFTEDVFLGLQFADASDHDASLIERVSAQVNSVAWHEDVRLYRSYLG
ncbi:hypothetical protein ABH926_006448 [Catenulispora sp. GP43]|uniref:DUF4303 domain-containing protein n=1 Tax=Catenulispora sp. GP43 TaxID=3156263 RepID=UPI003515F323